MKPRWAYIWEYTDLESGERRRTHLPVTRSEFQALTGQFPDESDIKMIDDTRVDRNAVRLADTHKPAKRIPEFDAPNDEEMRAIWRAHDDPMIRRVILEVVRGRRTMKEIEGLVAIIRQEYGSSLVAMNCLRCLVQDELWRAGRI